MSPTTSILGGVPAENLVVGGTGNQDLEMGRPDGDGQTIVQSRASGPEKPQMETNGFVVAQGELNDRAPPVPLVGVVGLHPATDGVLPDLVEGIGVWQSRGPSGLRPAPAGPPGSARDRHGR